MGTYTQLKETRTVLRDTEGDQIYKLELECVDEGPLDDTGIFVFQIFNTRNPLGDIFQRVAEVVDIETYLNNRDDAVAAGAEYWRNNTHTLEYDDVEVANAAVRTISDRVNTLVTNYTAYKTEFETTPDETLNFPTVDDTVIDERKAEYQAAVADYNTAQTAEATALAGRDDAQNDLDAANSNLLEWQVQQDKVCGGNLSEQGNEVGLQPGMDATGNAFLELLDGSGSVTWDTNSTAFRDAAQTFYNEATKIISGGGTSDFAKLTVSASEPAVASDIGKEVTDSANTGYLTAVSTVDSGTQYWWVGEADAGLSGAVTITGGAGAGTITAKDVTGASPYAALLTTLSTALTDMDSALDDAVIYKTPTEDTVADHIDTCNETTTTTSSKQAAANTASDTLKEKEAAYVTAQGATQAAYDTVIEKYDAVKEVCPDWSPDPPLPAQP